MKKKIIISIVIIFLIMLIFLNYKRIKGFLLYGADTCNGNCSSTSEEQLNIQDNYGVLVEKSFANYAYKKVYWGTVICNNGEIYEFDGELDKVDVLKSKNTKKKNKTVSESDLRIIKEYITSIEKKYKERSVGCDIGSSTISIYNNDERIILSETGDWERTNTSKYTKELLQIISKYL